jgi:DNA-binding NtrC family response regulator
VPFKPEILVIDDEEGIRKLLATILTEKGYNVDTAANGEEAIRKANEKVYNIALIDIMLPDISGVELLTQIKEVKPRTRKIIMTGNPSFQNAVEALNRGADAYVMKPLDVEKMLNTIAEQYAKQEAERKSTVDSFQSGKLRARIELIKRIGSEV